MKRTGRDGVEPVKFTRCVDTVSEFAKHAHPLLFSAFYAFDALRPREGYGASEVATRDPLLRRADVTGG